MNADVETLFPNCGVDCRSCGFFCKRASMIDEMYASRMAFALECLIVDYHGHWQSACDLLDEYKREWEKINPSPPTFMGEPMPADRRERLADMREGRKARGAV